MKDMRLTFDADMTGLEADDWFARLEDISDDLGYFEPLGADHVAAFLDAGPQLLVTFENADDIRTHHPDAQPRGFHYTRHLGWSHLAIISKAESWFRDVAIYRYFDRLIDDGFFEDFDNVLFHGAHAGGYAAAAYCVAAPGCTVLAIRPQATLDPRITGFDTRFIEQRRKNFTDRFGYAPDMIDAANEAFIAFDPLQRNDAIHAAMFTRSNMTPLRCKAMGNALETALDDIGIHDGLIQAAMTKTLTEAKFHTAMRSRRDHEPYLRVIFSRLIRTNHHQLAANLCAYILRKSPNNFFTRKLQDLEDQGYSPRQPLKVNAA